MRSLAVVFWILFVDCYWELYNVINNNRRKSKTIDKHDWLIFFSLMCTLNEQYLIWYFMMQLPVSSIHVSFVIDRRQKRKWLLAAGRAQKVNGLIFLIFTLYYFVLHWGFQASSKHACFVLERRENKNKYFLPAGHISLAFWYIWDRSISSK